MLDRWALKSSPPRSRSVCPAEAGVLKSLRSYGLSSFRVSKIAARRGRHICTATRFTSRYHWVTRRPRCHVSLLLVFVKLLSLAAAVAAGSFVPSSRRSAIYFHRQARHSTDTGRATGESSVCAFAWTCWPPCRLLMILLIHRPQAPLQRPSVDTRGVVSSCFAPFSSQNPTASFPAEALQPRWHNAVAGWLLLPFWR